MFYLMLAQVSDGNRKVPTGAGSQPRPHAMDASPARWTEHPARGKGALFSCRIETGEACESSELHMCPDDTGVFIDSPIAGQLFHKV